MTIPIPPSMRPAFERTEHPFHMWEAMMSIPGALAAVLDPAVARSVAPAAAALAGAPVLHLTGCGTSYFAGLAAAHALHRLTPALAVAHEAFEFVAYPPGGLKGGGLVAISHTGETGPVAAAVRLALEQGAAAVGLTDVAGSPLDNACSVTVGGGAGREPALPKTRSYVTTLLRLYLLAVEMAAQAGQDVAPLRQALAEVPALADAVLEGGRETVARIVRELDGVQRIVVIGGGPNWATALEGALKLKEAALVHAEGWELEESMHGPWVTLRPGDLVILLAMEGPSLAGAKRFAGALEEVGIPIWAITDVDAEVPGARFTTRLPALPEVFSPLLTILPLYLLTYGLALALGGRPDCMRLYDERYLKARLTMRPPAPPREG